MVLTHGNGGGGTSEHLAAAATIRTESSPQRPGAAQVAPHLSPFGCPSTPHLLPTRCRLAPGLGCPPRARKLFTKGNNSDKRIKIASKDGKHFVERSADRRGNRAVKETGGEGHREEWAAVTAQEPGAGTEPGAEATTRRERPRWPVTPLGRQPQSCAMLPGLKALKEGEPASAFT